MKKEEVEKLVPELERYCSGYTITFGNEGVRTGQPAGRSGILLGPQHVYLVMKSQYFLLIKPLATEGLEHALTVAAGRQQLTDAIAHHMTMFGPKLCIGNGRALFSVEQMGANLAGALDGLWRLSERGTANAMVRLLEATPNTAEPFERLADDGRRMTYNVDLAVTLRAYVLRGAVPARTYGNGTLLSTAASPYSLYGTLERNGQGALYPNVGPDGWRLSMDTGSSWRISIAVAPHLNNIRHPRGVQVDLRDINSWEIIVRDLIANLGTDEAARIVHKFEGTKQKKKMNAFTNQENIARLIEATLNDMPPMARPTEPATTTTTHFLWNNATTTAANVDWGTIGLNAAGPELPEEEFDDFEEAEEVL